MTAERRHRLSRLFWLENNQTAASANKRAIPVEDGSLFWTLRSLWLGYADGDAFALKGDIDVDRIRICAEDRHELRITGDDVYLTSRRTGCGGDICGVTADRWRLRRSALAVRQRIQSLNESVCR